MHNLAATVPGWVLFPQTIEYQDGSTWQLKDDGQCYQIYWRDEDHPQLDTLPPLQVEMSDD